MGLPLSPLAPSGDLCCLRSECCVPDGAYLPCDEPPCAAQQSQYTGDRVRFGNWETPAIDAGPALRRSGNLIDLAVCNLALRHSLVRRTLNGAVAEPKRVLLLNSFGR